MLRKFLAALMMFAAYGLLLIAPAVSQDGSGVITLANPRGTNGIGALNPLVCDNPDCQHLVDLLFPTLFAVDPANGTITGAAPGNYGLVLEPEAPQDTLQTFQLRDDLAWSDGTPITAYDVFYSYLAITSQWIGSPLRGQITLNVSGAQVIDDKTIAFAYKMPGCPILSRANFPIVPSRIFDPDFDAFVDSFGTQDAEPRPYEEWLEAYPEQKFSILNSHRFNTNPSATAGAFDFDEIRPMQDIRLIAEDGAQAFVYTDLASSMSAVQVFLAGGTNILVNPPLENRDDLKAAKDIQIAEFPGPVWNFIAFNTADPREPKSTYNEDGELVDQGHHPIFGDPRVRRAIQMAINVDQLIEVTQLGYGTQVAANQPPQSWAFDPTLEPIGYDLRAAQQLLEEAGWKDVNRDGIRECRGCLYAQQDSPFYINLMAMDGQGRPLAANFIARQLQPLGVYINLNVMDANSVISEARQQRYDAYLGGWTQPYTSDPDQTSLFTRAGDVLGSGDNTGSYTNERIETLMEQARTLPGCDTTARAEIYHEIQQILQEDQPYIWLYSANDMVAADSGVLGFDPRPGRPFWNIRDWVVVK